MNLKKLITLTAMTVLTGNVWGQTDNLLQGWDGTGCTTANPKPSDFGWTSSENRTFNQENASGGIRFTTKYSGYKLSDGTSYTYSADSNPSSKIFWIRYNTSGESFTYTTNSNKLQAGHTYKYSALVGWHNNSNAPTLTTKIKAGDKELATVSKYVSVKQTLYLIEKTFKVSDDVDATSFSVSFTCNQTGDCMIALSALSIVEVAPKEELKAIIDGFKVPTTNVGDGAFQYPTQEIEDINTALQTAQEVYKDNNATIDDVNAQIAIVSNLTIPALNSPAANTRYSIKNVSLGYQLPNKAMTLTNDRNDAGGYNVRYFADPNSNYGQAFEFTSVPDKKDTYYLSQTDKDGNTRYLCLGSKYDGGTIFQIRTTTTKDDAAEFCVIPMAEENNWKIINVEANIELGANGNNDNGVYTTRNYYRMVIAPAEQAQATLKVVTGVKYGTFIAPFKANKPENVTLYSVEEVNGSTLTLVEAQEIAANTPYIVYADEEETITATLQAYGTATQDTYEAGKLVGTLPGGTMSLGTDCYLLQKNNDVVGFYRCEADVSYKLGANRAYLKYSTPAGVKAFFFGEENQTTAITTLSELMNGKAEIYDLNGRKLRKLEKGINIVNGKKVIIK